MREQRIEMLKSMIPGMAGNPFPQYGLGLEYAAMDDLPQAENWFREALMQQADYVPALFQLGQLLARTGRTPEAIEILQKGMTLAKTSGDSKTAGEFRQLLDDLE